jgi:hypothetical protein
MGFLNNIGRGIGNAIVRGGLPQKGLKSNFSGNQKKDVGKEKGLVSSVLGKRGYASSRDFNNRFVKGYNAEGKRDDRFFKDTNIPEYRRKYLAGKIKEGLEARYKKLTGSSKKFEFIHEKDIKDAQKELNRAIQIRQGAYKDLNEEDRRDLKKTLGELLDGKK